MTVSRGVMPRIVSQDAGPDGPRSTICAIGEAERIRAYALAGVQLGVADDADAARAAWRGLGPDVGLVILTPAAHSALAAEGQDPHDDRSRAPRPCG